MTSSRIGFFPSAKEVVDVIVSFANALRMSDLTSMNTFASASSAAADSNVAACPSLAKMQAGAGSPSFAKGQAGAGKARRGGRRASAKISPVPSPQALIFSSRSRRKWTYSCGSMVSVPAGRATEPVSASEAHEGQGENTTQGAWPRKAGTHRGRRARRWHV